MTPFDYPKEETARRHAPSGYPDSESYRPWIRDEFTFRCIYCLRRERWEPDLGVFEIDHLVPIGLSPELQSNYANLVYSCRTCNAAKGMLLLVDPRSALLAEHLIVESDGRISPRSDPARHLVRLLDLNDPMYVTWRMRMIRIVALARIHDPALFRDLLGYPDELPDLSRLRPPGGNTRPEGIAESYFVRHQRGELPETY